jgi:hypothetical protein
MVRFQVEVFLLFWRCDLFDCHHELRTAQSAPAVNRADAVPTVPLA